MTSILFRTDSSTEEEKKIAIKYFDVVEHRTHCRSELVIGRYSVLPYYAELVQDLHMMDCTLINSYRQHKWIADFEYYDAVEDYTPQTWLDHDFHTAPEGKYVVKGKTNSRKHNWNKLMFANNKREASNIAAELMQDSLIGPQGVVYREYVPLMTFEYGLNGLPFTNEWRFFCYQDKILSCGYYWSNASDGVRHSARMDSDATYLVIDKLMPIVKEYVNFYVLDIAQTAEGKWILIEINDGQMAGLSENNPNELYKKLAEVVKYG